ncbi:SH3 domain-containing protein [[Candida] zeylanoides]
MGLNNPIPRSLRSESKKAAKVLASFIKPNQVVGPNEIIPPHILKNAKGLAVITVLKAGFLFSGRAGSGVIVARLPDGSWSPPTAIMTAGAGVGGQIGAELTDFVFILNSKAAVDSFAQAGSITLGTNVSVAAGPLGRNAEAAATASLRSASAVFAYSKTKGLFAGVSLEGSAIVERRDANRKFYGSNCKARTILAGGVETPPACEPLMRVLQSRVFNNRFPGESEIFDDDYYDDIPTDFSDSTSASSRPRSGSRGARGARYDSDEYSDDDDDGRYRTNSTRRTSQYSSKRWEDDIYDRGGVDGVTNRLGGTRISSGPARPASSKPNFGGAPKVNARQAIALYTFKGEQAGDLAFKKGDVIDIVKKTDTVDDWWTGRCNGGEGIFPANYVELI